MASELDNVANNGYLDANMGTSIPRMHYQYMEPRYLATLGNLVNISVLEAGGFADIDRHEKFCAAGDCVIATIFDQTQNHNHLAQRISDGVVHKMVNASRHKIAVAGGKTEVFGMWFDPGHVSSTLPFVRAAAVSLTPTRF